jgi:hypothetical protein
VVTVGLTYAWERMAVPLISPPACEPPISATWSRSQSLTIQPFHLPRPRAPATSMNRSHPNPSVDCPAPFSKRCADFF